MDIKPQLATLCYIFQNDNVLLLHRIKKKKDIHEGKYIGLGGKMEAYESPRECILREIYEEAGIAPEDILLRAIIYFKEEKHQNQNQNLNPALNYLVFVYRATKFKGQIDNSPEGVLMWVPLKDFNNLNVWDGDKIFVPKLINEDQFFEATFTYTFDEKFIGYELY